MCGGVCCADGDVLSSVAPTVVCVGVRVACLRVVEEAALTLASSGDDFVQEVTALVRTLFRWQGDDVLVAGAGRALTRLLLCAPHLARCALSRVNGFAALLATCNAQMSAWRAVHPGEASVLASLRPRPPSRPGMRALSRGFGGRQRREQPSPLATEGGGAFTIGDLEDAASSDTGDGDDPMELDPSIGSAFALSVSTSRVGASLSRTLSTTPSLSLGLSPSLLQLGINVIDDHFMADKDGGGGGGGGDANRSRARSLSSVADSASVHSLSSDAVDGSAPSTPMFEDLWTGVVSAAGTPLLSDSVDVAVPPAQRSLLDAARSALLSVMELYLASVDDGPRVQVLCLEDAAVHTSHSKLRGEITSEDSVMRSTLLRSLLELLAVRIHCDVTCGVV
jgi:hypothetical protein